MRKRKGLGIQNSVLVRKRRKHVYPNRIEDTKDPSPDIMTETNNAPAAFG